MILPGSYANGFAPRDGQPLYPELWRGCVGAWAPCLGPTGLMLRDWSGYGYHGELTNMDAASDWVVDSGCYAIDFDGSNDYLQTPVNVGGLNSLSVSFWIYPRTQTSAAGVGGVFCDWVSGSLKILIRVSGTSLDFFTFTSGAIGGTIASLTLNRWQHITVRYTGTVMDAFVNGVRSATTFSQTGQIATTGSRLIRIGGGGNGSGASSEGDLNGRLDGIMLHAYAISRHTNQLLYLRRGIAYELARRRRTSAGIAFNRRRRLLVGAGT